MTTSGRTRLTCAATGRDRLSWINAIDAAIAIVEDRDLAHAEQGAGT